MDSNVLKVFKPNIFEGKVLLCTGATGSICGHTTRTLVQLGCDAVIVGRTEERLLKAQREISKFRKDSKIFTFKGDVSDYKQMVECVNFCVSKLNKIDFVIVGAAGNFLADIERLSANGFAKVVQVDLLGSYNVAKAAMGELKKSKGSIIFISATFHYRGTIFQAHCSSAKAGVDALMKTIAVEYGPFGIRSNCIAPGAIGQTEGLARLASTTQDTLVNQIPLQKLGECDDITLACVYLLSDAAKYISGTTLIVDGGQHQAPYSILPYPDFIVKPELVDEMLNSLRAKSKSRMTKM